MGTNYKRWWLLIGALVLYIPFLGEMNLFDWDEINFAESAREMSVTGDWLTVQIDFKPFWEKPPLFIWMQALCMQVFGVGEFAARLPNAIAGVLTLQVLYWFGNRWKDESFGFWWSVLYGLSFLPFLYFKSGIIDPWFNLFIFLGLAFFIEFYHSSNSKVIYWVMLSAAFIGLSVLTKGPVGFLIFALVVGCVFLRDFLRSSFSKQVTWTRFLLWWVLFLLVGGSWFFMLMINGKTQVIEDFLMYQVRLFQTEDAGHGGFPLYHFVIWLMVLFPIGWMSISGLWQKGMDAKVSSQVFWMRCLFWVVIVLFSIVKTKIVHYSSMMYFPVSFLAALLLVGDFQWKNWQKSGLWFTAFVWSILVFLMPYVDSYKSSIIQKGWIKDDFAVANLQASTSWTGLELWVVLLFMSGMTYFLWSRKVAYKQHVFLGSLVLFTVFVIHVVPYRVEKYSQAAAISFCERAAKEQIPIYSVGYKSYATLFYGARKPAFSLLTVDDYLLQSDAIPCYFIFKVTAETEIKETYKDLKEIERKNGFVLAKRF
jgi:4-amino-4-deoxy-L-arabinose transferase-like glycosyltransferase